MDKRIRFCILLFLLLVAMEEVLSERKRCLGSKCAKTRLPTRRFWKRSVDDDRDEQWAEETWRRAIEELEREFKYESGTFKLCVNVPDHNRLAGNEEEGSLIYFRLQGERVLTPEFLFSSERHVLRYSSACSSFTRDDFAKRPLLRLRWKNVGWDGIRPKDWYFCKVGDENYKYKCHWECESGWNPECVKKTSANEHEQTTDLCTQMTEGNPCSEWY